MAYLEITKDTTRIDIETAGAGAFVYLWDGKWEQGSESHKSYYIETRNIPTVLKEAEDAGFTCEMCDASHGRALRGEVTRADILQEGDQWVYRTFPRGWTAKTRPLKNKLISADEAAKIIAWCKEHSWKVREFPGGVRAWKYEVMPVRDSSTIRYLRRQIDEAIRRGHSDERRNFDLAYDC